MEIENVYEKKTYITKEKFMELIAHLDFKYIESADIKFITVFMFNSEKDNISPKGYTINIT